MFVRGGLNFETGYFGNQIQKGGGTPPFLGGETEGSYCNKHCRVPLKFARLCIEHYVVS